MELNFLIKILKAKPMRVEQSTVNSPPIQMVQIITVQIMLFRNTSYLRLKSVFPIHFFALYLVNFLYY